MSRQTRNILLTTLMFSIFFGFMISSTGGFFFPSLRFATQGLLCDGEMEQRLPIGNRRLNLYCHPADGGEPYAVAFVPYVVSTTLFYGALAFVPIFALSYWSMGRPSRR
jgi:hypothetical protein